MSKSFDDAGAKLPVESAYPCTLTVGRAEISLLVIFALVNVAILFVASADAPIRHGADANSWLLPARALLEYGDLVDWNNPGNLQTFRPPIYPAIVALNYLVSPTSMIPIIVLQLVMLAATAWMTRTIVGICLPRYASIAMAIVLFNPSAIGTAHLLQSDTIYAFLVTATILTVFRYAHLPELRMAIACGLVFGLVTMTRNTAQFLLYALPIALPVLVMIGKRNVSSIKASGHGVVALCVALVVTSPWIAHMVRADEGVTLSSIRIKAAFLWDNVTYLEKFEAGVGLSEAERRTRQKRATFTAWPEHNWQDLSAKEQHQLQFDYAAKEFFEYSWSTYARAYGWGALQFFAIPGVSNLLNILELNERTPFAVFRARAYDNYWEAGLAALSEASPWATAITVAGFVLVVPLRILGLLGLIVAWQRRHYISLAIVVAVVGYFAAIHMFVGNSRYRLPVEPLLVLASIYGLDALRTMYLDRVRRRSSLKATP